MVVLETVGVGFVDVDGGGGRGLGAVPEKVHDGWTKRKVVVVVVRRESLSDRLSPVPLVFKNLKAAEPRGWALQPHARGLVAMTVFTLRVRICSCDIDKTKKQRVAQADKEREAGKKRCEEKKRFVAKENRQGWRL